MEREEEGRTGVDLAPGMDLVRKKDIERANEEPQCVGSCS